MKEVTRRGFLGKLVVGGAVLGIGSVVRHEPIAALASGKHDIGLCKSVKIKCVSELGWFDSKLLGKQVKAGGGPKTNQYSIPWDPNNGAGCCTLIDMETLDGKHHKILMDTGWNTKYIDECMKREGIDEMLKKREIDLLFVSHEHLDHFWGLESVLKHDPGIKIIIPNTFNPEGMHYLKGAEYITPGIRNGIPHTGELVQLEPGSVNRLFPGCGAAAWDIPISVQVHGEQSLYFNVKNKGIVCVTGCCHQKIMTLADFAREKLVGGENLYGLYGGLHIAPKGSIDPKREHIIKGMGKYDFKKIACNHCTGLAAVERMIELGYPIVRGTARFGSKSKLYVGNGDEVVFG